VAVSDDEYCEITGIGPIPVSVARAMLTEAIVKLVITKGEDVLHVTHLGRGPKMAQRIALLWQQRCALSRGAAARGWRTIIASSGEKPNTPD